MGLYVDPLDAVIQQERDRGLTARGYLPILIRVVGRRHAIRGGYRCGACGEICLSPDKHDKYCHER